MKIFQLIRFISFHFYFLLSSVVEKIIPHSVMFCFISFILSICFCFSVFGWSQHGSIFWNYVIVCKCFFFLCISHENCSDALHAARRIGAIYHCCNQQVLLSACYAFFGLLTENVRFDCLSWCMCEWTIITKKKNRSIR